MEPVRRAQVVALDKLRIWHPYTEMSRYRGCVDPLVIVEARGPYLFDANGRSYIDANGSWWSSNLGHQHPRLVAALQRQAERLAHVALGGIVHEAAAELAEALCRAAPVGLEHVFFTDNGSTAVEVAIQLALQYWHQNGRSERKQFVALEGAFHGETLGATALGGVDVFRSPFEGALLGCVHVPVPGQGSSTEQAVDSLARVLERDADRIAGLVVESMVQGAAGMRIYDAAFLTAARELCTRHDVFLICDEVFTGYGRTGPMWACEHAGIVPDLLCTAKGFSGGMLPMAATLATDRIFEGFLGSADRAFYYGHTFYGNPLGASVAREVLRVYQEERILERAKPKAECIARAFAEMGGLPGVAATRWLGMIGALELAGDAGYLAEAGWRVYDAALARGVYLRPIGNVVYVAPALNIPDPDLGLLLEAVRDSVSESM